jgi:hypothetical protein
MANPDCQIHDRFDGWVVLAAALPLQDGRQSRGIRIALVALSVIGTGAVQFANDRSNDETNAILLSKLGDISTQNSSRLLARQPEQVQDKVREREAESRGALELDPCHTLAAVQGNDKDFLDKAKMLALGASTGEAAVLSNCSPQQAAPSLAFPS